MNALKIIEGWGRLTLQELEILKEDPEGARRLAICTKCPNITEVKTCKLCGCFMPAKVLLHSERCANYFTKEKKDFWNDHNN